LSDFEKERTQRLLYLMWSEEYDKVNINKQYNNIRI